MGLFGKTETVELTVTGMTCGNCVQHVSEALQGVPGVKRAQVDLDTGAATVSVRPGTSIEALVAAVARAGYEASVAAAPAA